jgi:hypothetical protein
MPHVFSSRSDSGDGSNRKRTSLRPPKINTKLFTTENTGSTEERRGEERRELKKR